jgi:hypothetical protein
MTASSQASDTQNRFANWRYRPQADIRGKPLNGRYAAEADGKLASPTCRNRPRAVYGTSVITVRLKTVTGRSGFARAWQQPDPKETTGKLKIGRSRKINV